MRLSETYRRQASLLVRILPHVAAEECFALKGGTAINLFVRDMPRVSVDVDLTYLPVAARVESLGAIDSAMSRIAGRIRGAFQGIRVTGARTRPEGALVKLLVRQEAAQVKIEVTPVLRGCVFEPQVKTVCSSVEEQFGFAETQVVSFEDLYAGKLVAALDRQHPRDLFDVHVLMENEGIPDSLRQAFLVYVVSHNRPMAEILAPARKLIGAEFARGFEGMTSASIGIDELVTAREAMIAAVVDGMPDDHRRFLLSFERGDPEWALLGLPEVEKLPAVQWRKRNLDGMSRSARAKLLAGLEAVLRG